MHISITYSRRQIVVVRNIHKSLLYMPKMYGIRLGKRLDFQIKKFLEWSNFCRDFLGPRILNQLLSIYPLRSALLKTWNRYNMLTTTIWLHTAIYTLISLYSSIYLQLFGINGFNSFKIILKPWCKDTMFPPWWGDMCGLYIWQDIPFLTRELFIFW